MLPETLVAQTIPDAASLNTGRSGPGDAGKIDLELMPNGLLLLAAAAAISDCPKVNSS